MKEKIRQFIDNSQFDQAFTLLQSQLQEVTAVPERIDLLRIQAKAELSFYKDDRYLDSLKAINAISDDIMDHIVYVYQLIKDRQLETAFEYYQNICRKKYSVKLKEKLQLSSQLVSQCEDFYRWQLINNLQQYLTKVSVEYSFKHPEKSRVEKFINQIFNLKQFYQDSKQKDHRPSYLAYPDLQDEPFVELNEISKTDSTRLISTIKQQVFKILTEQKGEPYVQNRAGVPNGLAHLIDSHQWRSVVVFEAGKIQLALAKDLVAILQDNFDLADCAPLAPEVMISILEPDTHITPHYGTSNIKHTMHIPIVLPKGDLAIVVGGQQRCWESDQCLVFDDSFQHEAWNKSKETRIVLIVDLWHNKLSTNEKKFLSQTMQTIVSTQLSLAF